MVNEGVKDFWCSDLGVRNYFLWRILLNNVITNLGKKAYLSAICFMRFATFLRDVA